MLLNLNNICHFNWYFIHEIWVTVGAFGLYDGRTKCTVSVVQKCVCIILGIRSLAAKCRTRSYRSSPKLLIYHVLTFRNRHSCNGFDIWVSLTIAIVGFCYSKDTFTSCNIDTKIKEKLLRTYVWSTALYDGESEKKTTLAFEVWCYERILKISRTDRITNELGPFVEREAKIR